MRFALGVLIGVGLVVGVIVISSGGGGSSSPSPPPSPTAASEALVEHAAEGDVQRAALFPDDWLIYSRCATKSRCAAELRFVGLPTVTLATDRYRVRQSMPRRVGVSHIEVTLATDGISDCSGRYVGSGDVSDLMACASR